MANPFGAVKVTAPGKSVFTLTHEKQLTMGIGTLIPIFSKMVNAGEKFKIQSEFMLRMNPLIAPVMGRMNVDIHYFYCKNMDLWSKFYEFMSGVDNLGNEFTAVNPFCVKWWQYYDALCHVLNEKVIKEVTLNGTKHFSFAGTILDYLGYPVLVSESMYNYFQENGSTRDFASDYEDYDTHYFNLFPLFNYQKIYYEYYSKEAFEADVFSKILDGITTLYLREEDKNVFSINTAVSALSPALQDFDNLVSEVIPDEFQGDTSLGSLMTWLITPHLRKYANDYFTSANPWTQKGQAPKVPISGAITPQSDFEITAQNIRTAETAEWIDNGDGATATLGGHGTKARVSVSENTSAEIEGYFNISDLRIATAVQRLLEKFATAGTRINEYLRAVFGASDPSLELGRALYLGGTSTPMEISTVFQSSETNQTPLGDMGGKGMSAGVSPYVSYKVPQHGVIIGIMSVRPKLVYDNVIERELTYFDRFDYPTPDLQHVGEQAIYNFELNAPMTSGEGTFVTLGYQQRYGEAKYIPSTRHGEIKRGHSLEFWSAYNPSESPQSISELIAVNPTNYGMMFNYVGLSEEDTRSQLIVHVLNKVSAKRPLSFYSTPSL